MTRTIVGVFDATQKIDAALEALRSAGIRQDQIKLSDAVPMNTAPLLSPIVTTAACSAM